MVVFPRPGLLAAPGDGGGSGHPLASSEFILRRCDLGAAVELGHPGEPAFCFARPNPKAALLLPPLTQRRGSQGTWAASGPRCTAFCKERSER